VEVEGCHPCLHERNRPGTGRIAAPDAAPRKDRLIQTRVPEDLESTLKEEAARRRLSVSHLIRSVLEDTFHLVDGVVSDFDRLVTDSVDLARNVKRNAQRLAASTQGEKPVQAGGDDLDDIYGWNEIVLQRAATCLRCGNELPRGERVFAGMSDQPRRRALLCRACIEKL
jgi:hypothetical protein